MPIKDVEEVEYARLLDTLARFYNSEITAHVGYELSITVGLIATLVGATSIVASVYGSLLPAMVLVDVLCIVAFFTLGLPPCFKYLYGRLQYYGGLSETTFKLMGLKTPYIRTKDGAWRMHDMVRRLRKKALQDKAGIEGGITGLFLARLYASKCKRDKTDESVIEQNLRSTFKVDLDTVRPYDVYVIPVRPFPSWLARKLRWMHVDVLLLACRQTTGSMDPKIAQLLFTDC